MKSEQQTVKSEKIVIATRASDLALWQAYHIKDRIEKQFPNI